VVVPATQVIIVKGFSKNITESCSGLKQGTSTGEKHHGQKHKQQQQQQQQQFISSSSASQSWLGQVHSS
jgi:hypothetical protein